MRGGKYPSRGNSYGYYDPYYSSPPSRGRGGYRGRGRGRGNSGYYGSSNGYNNFSGYGSNTYSQFPSYPPQSGSNVTPTSSAGSIQEQKTPRAPHQTSGTYDQSTRESAKTVIENGGNTDDFYENTEYGQALGYRGSGFRARGRGAAPRGSWRGNRSSSGGSYYGKARYDHHDATTGGDANVNEQYGYGREFVPGSGTGVRPGSISDNIPPSREYHTDVADSKFDADTERRKSEEQKNKQERDQKKNREFKEKHWIERVHATGDSKKQLNKYFNELDAHNAKLLDLGTRRAELEIDINRYNRILKAEEDRVRLAEEKLETMNLSI